MGPALSGCAAGTYQADSGAAVTSQVGLSHTAAEGKGGEAWSQQNLRPGRQSSSLRSPKPEDRAASCAQKQSLEDIAALPSRVLRCARPLKSNPC